jgi:succinate dehydrogenase / fumarate reductase cytochrome b subunit
MRLPITAWASITHRATGVFLFVGMAILIWALDKSLSGPEGFAAVQECLANPLSKLVIWAVVAALIYHSLAGVKHLVMDFGVGETMEGGIMGVRIVIALTVVLTILAGVAIW